MEKNLTIGEAAKAVHMTAETLRHYDRIGLVQPSVKDPWTRYRYYSPQDLIRLHTVRALQQMDLPLEKIKEVLGYADLQQIVHFLAEAERTADKKIVALQYSKAKIQAARQTTKKNSKEQLQLLLPSFARTRPGFYCFPRSGCSYPRQSVGLPLSLLRPYSFGAARSFPVRGCGRHLYGRDTYLHVCRMSALCAYHRFAASFPAGNISASAVPKKTERSKQLCSAPWHRSNIVPYLILSSSRS